MVGNSGSRVCNPQAEALDEYLAENGFSGFAPRDLDGIEEAFSLLQARFSKDVYPTELSEGRDSVIASPGEAAEADDAEPAATARRARRNASPVVRIFPVGTFAIGVPSPGELFRFIGFGTISTDVYEELVWEDVQRLPGYQSLETKVYEVNKTDGKLRFEMLFQGQVFEFIYFHSEILARSIGPSWPISGTLRHEACGVEVQEAVQEVEESIKKKSLFADDPSHHRAYYTFRAWSILKGLWNRSNSKDVICALGNSPVDKQLDYNATITTIFGDSSLTSKYRPCPENSDQDLLGILKTLGSTPICERMGTNFFLLINTMVSGCSNIVIGKWLSLVERRLPRLVQFLRAPSPKNDQADSEASVTLWPNRLTFDFNAENIGSQAGVHESCFVIGLKLTPNSEERLRIDDETNVWMASILKHEYTLAGRTIISTQLLPASDERMQSLSTCSRIFPRASLPAPSPLRDDDEETEKETHKISGKTKGKRSSTTNTRATQSSPKHDATGTESPPSAGKFPTATQVHNRLKYDSKYNIEEYVIGYKDLDTIAEMPAENWIRETTDEAFVPESRVRYFARYTRGVKEVVWDREERVDGMFRKKVE